MNKERDLLSLCYSFHSIFALIAPTKAKKPPTLPISAERISLLLHPSDNRINISGNSPKVATISPIINAAEPSLGLSYTNLAFWKLDVTVIYVAVAYVAAIEPSAVPPNMIAKIPVGSKRSAMINPITRNNVAIMNIFVPVVKSYSAK